MVSFQRHLLHSLEPCSHGHWIRVESSTVMYLEAAGMIEDRHDLPRSAHCTHWETTAYNFGEARQIRLDTKGIRSATIGEAKIENLVGDQQDPVACGLLAKELEKTGPSCDHADSERHRIKDERCQIVAMLEDSLAADLQPV